MTFFQMLINVLEDDVFGGSDLGAASDALDKILAPSVLWYFGFQTPQIFHKLSKKSFRDSLVSPVPGDVFSDRVVISGILCITVS